MINEHSLYFIDIEISSTVVLVFIDGAMENKQKEENIVLFSHHNRQHQAKEEEASQSESFFELLYSYTWHSESPLSLSPNYLQVKRDVRLSSRRNT